MNALDQAVGGAYRLEVYNVPSPNELIKGQQPLVSIFNDTDESINVEFSFSYQDCKAHNCQNIVDQDQITNEYQGLEIAPREWCDVTIEPNNDFHSRNNVRITRLFELKVNGANVYDNHRYAGIGSERMIQSYIVKDWGRVISLPSTLKISKNP